MKNTLLLLAGMVSVSNAAILAEYTFANPTGNLTLLNSTDSNLDTTALDFTSGSGFSIVTTTITTAFANENSGVSDGTDDNLAGAIGANDYFSFTVNANSGFAFDLDSITLDVSRGSRGTQDYYLFSSASGFAAGDVLASALNVGTAGSDIDFTFSSDASFDGLSTVEFRVVIDDRANNGSGSSSAILDNVILNGTVTAVPEPTSVALLGLGGLALVARRRR